MAKIISLNAQKSVLNDNNSAGAIALRVKEKRLKKNLTQASLSKRSGVSLGTLKRFEHTHEISLKHLLMIAAALGCADDFSALFAGQEYSTFDEAVDYAVRETRKRGRIND